MDSLLILIPVALIFVAIAVKAFLWAVDNHQYDDLDAAAESILFDDVDVTIDKIQSDSHDASSAADDESAKVNVVERNG